MNGLLVEDRVLSTDRAQPVDGWKHLAACKDADPDLFYPDINGSSRIAYREAMRICRACEVRQQCLDDALASDDRWGMRGGVTPRARARMRRAIITNPGPTDAERAVLYGTQNEEHQS